MLFHMLRFNVQECRRIGKQLLLRQICMAVSRRLEQGVKKAAADPVIGVGKDTYFAAISSAILNPTPWISSASWYGFSWITEYIPGP